MKSAQVLAWLIVAGILMTADISGASERDAGTWRYDSRSAEPPFLHGKRAAAVWASDRCWKECGSYCTWGMAGCLQQDTQGRCLKLADRCDRYCQRQCRTMSGPYLPIELPWD